MQIEKITVKNEIAKITVGDEEKSIVYKMSVTDLIEGKYTLNQQLTEQDMAELADKHLYFYAYNKCLKKLANADRSQKEIEDTLKEVRGLKHSQREKIVESLKSMGYLSDEAVVESQLYIDQTKLLGRKKTKYILTQRGVDKAIADEVLNEVDISQEIERGIQKAEKISKLLKNKSYKDKIQTIRNRLMADGFENIDDIISGLDLQKDQQQEETVLHKCALTAVRKYSNKYSGRKLYDSCFKYLMSKGFETDMIRNELTDMEVTNEN